MKIIMNDLKENIYIHILYLYMSQLHGNLKS